MAVLTAHWDLEGDSTDHIGSYNGTDTAITYAEEYGVISQGALFNGSTSKIVISDASALKPTGAFTIGAWIKTSTSATQIFQSYAYSTNVAGIYLDCGLSVANKLTILSGRNNGTVKGTNYEYVQSITSITDGVWHLCIGSWDSAYLNIYVDGRHENRIAWVNAPAYQATNYVRIGSYVATGSDTYYFNGSLDEVFLINGTALSAQEIWELYNGSYVGMVRS